MVDKIIKSPMRIPTEQRPSNFVFVSKIYRMSLKELFCELCCSILNTNSNIPKISPFIHGDKLNKLNPGLLSPKRHLIKRQI